MTTNIKTQNRENEKSKFPLHGWLGLSLIIVFWILNWTLTGPRTHWGFFPLWLGYCLAIDGLVFWHTGTSLITRGRRKYISLFLVSARGMVGSEGDCLPPPVLPQMRHKNSLCDQNKTVAFGGGAALGAEGGWGYNSTMPAKRSNSKTMHRAGELRKDLTPAEKKLWARLRGKQLNGVSFRRQHAIGNYIPDFVSIKGKLIIELDGGQHVELEEYDSERTRYFESLGYKVVRFWNREITKDIDGVIRAIALALDE